MISLELKTKLLQSHPFGSSCSIGLFITASENGVCLDKRLLDTRFLLGLAADEVLSHPDLKVPEEFTQEWIHELSDDLEQLSSQIGFDHKAKKIR